MPSLFDGTDEVICGRLGIADRRRLVHGLPRETLSNQEALGLVEAIYGQMERNFPGRVRSRSTKLWSCRRKTTVSAHNPSAETLLEKAVAILADRGHMPNWFNQCPVASGVVDPSSDKRRCVDLVHLSSETVRLVELKWRSDSPAYALFQVLEYGLAYLLARLRRRDFGLETQPIMQDSVTSIRLDVIAPAAFFAGNAGTWLLGPMDHALTGFAARQSNGAFSMCLRALAFPRRFRTVPFASGADVKRKCGSGTFTPEARAVRDAFDTVVPPA